MNRIRTTKSRDFILAVMPQYGFYKVPPSAKDMTFSQLFIDCCNQLELANMGEPCRMAPLIFGGFPPTTRSQRTYSSSDSIPEITTLGEFYKLLNGSRLISGTTGSPCELNTVEVNLLYNVPEDVTIELIQDSLEYSQLTWICAGPGDLGGLRPQNEGNNPTSDFGIHHVIEDLTFWLRQINQNESLVRKAIQLLGTGRVIRAAAMAVCGVPHSSFEWCEEHLFPVLVHVRDKLYLALVPYSVLDGRYIFALAKAQRGLMLTAQFALVAFNAEMNEMVMCLFPADVKVGLE